MSDSQVLTSAIYAKTPLGVQEMQTRSLGLLPLVRRILVLIDGKRSYAELATLVPAGNDVAPMIETLLEQGCVQVQSVVQSPAKTAQAPAAAPSEAAQALQIPSVRSIPGLPPASARSAKENDMARHFMINSVNGIIGQGMRISLIHDIFHADSTEKLREVYFAWEASMSNHGMGAKRLPELRVKLFKVL